MHMENALELAYALDMRDTALMDAPIWKEWRVIYDAHTGRPFIERPPGAVEIPKSVARAKLTSALADCLRKTVSGSFDLQKLRSDGIIDLMRPPPPIAAWPTYGVMDLITASSTVQVFMNTGEIDHVWCMPWPSLRYRLCKTVGKQIVQTRCKAWLEVTNNLLDIVQQEAAFAAPQQCQTTTTACIAQVRALLPASHSAHASTSNVLACFLQPPAPTQYDSHAILDNQTRDSMIPRLMALRGLLENDLRRYRVDEAECETFLLEWREKTFFHNGRIKRSSELLEMDRCPGPSTATHSFTSDPLPTGASATLLVEAGTPSACIHSPLASNVTVEAGTLFGFYAAGFPLDLNTLVSLPAKCPHAPCVYCCVSCALSASVL
jgi:hypothetical protein